MPGGVAQGRGVGMLAIERYLRTCESWFTRSSWLFSHTLILVLTHSNLILVDTLVLVHTLLVALAATVELERECHVHEDVVDVHALLHLDAWGAREGHAQDHNVMTIMTMTRFNCWTFAFRLRRKQSAFPKTSSAADSQRAVGCREGEAPAVVDGACDPEERETTNATKQESDPTFDSKMFGKNSKCPSSVRCSSMLQSSSLMMRMSSRFENIFTMSPMPIMLAGCPGAHTQGRGLMFDFG